MEEHQQSIQELEQHLADQIEFLRSSADGYDRGFEGEAKRIAVSVCILCHDTRRSQSLLGQLGKKDLPFYDTAHEETPGNQVGHSGLIVSTLSESRAKYVAPLDGGWTKPSLQSFASWWNKSVFVDLQGRALSRKDVVVSVADQDGGAHVDPTLNSAYAELSRNNALGWSFSDGSTTTPMGGPERAALRQICHELLKTLVPDYKKEQTFEGAGIIMGGAVMISGPVAQNPPGNSVRKDLSRTAPCPCGSGNWYKKCCGKLV